MIVSQQPNQYKNNKMITQKEYQNRRTILSSTVSERALDAFLVSSEENIYYLTGASYKPLERPFFIVIWPSREPTLVVPMLEKEHMEKAGIGNVVAYWEYPSPRGSGWPEILQQILGNVSNVGVEPSLSLEIAGKLRDFSLSPMPLIEEMRLVKSPAEVAMIKKTAEYTDIGMSKILNASYLGASVVEIFSLSKSLQVEVLRSGDYDPVTSSFLTVTWPAPFSSQPHGIPKAEDRLKSGPLVAMSFHRINGYSAEVERTYFHQQPTKDERELFEHMTAAGKCAMDLVKPGIPCAEVDAVANNYLRENGFAENLLHRTGHGIGLGNHEGPYVAEGSDETLQENMVISIEPGIYIPEIGGFRHSDTVLVTSSGYELLTHSPIDLDSLTITNYKPFKRLKGKLIRRAVGI